MKQYKWEIEWQIHKPYEVRVSSELTQGRSFFFGKEREEVFAQARTLLKQDRRNITLKVNNIWEIGND